VTATDTSALQDRTEYTVEWTFSNLRRGQTASAILDGTVIASWSGTDTSSTSTSAVVSSVGAHMADGYVYDRKGVAIAPLRQWARSDPDGPPTVRGVLPVQTSFAGPTATRRPSTRKVRRPTLRWPSA